ncbi:sugar-binding protein [Kribbella sp. GL6]|uniref:sugar-binding protein n=1 Tax=Kribbella sp. GL6 TaxID=3419765 RepID=UPI003D052037
MHTEESQDRPGWTRRGFIAGVAIPAGAAAIGLDWLTTPTALATGSAATDQPVMISDFETGLDGWVVRDGLEFDPDHVVVFGFEQSSARANTGSYSGLLTTDFSHGAKTNAYVAIRKDFSYPGRIPPTGMDIQELTFWTYPVNIGRFLLRATDSTGQTHQQHLVVGQQNQWLELTVSTFTGSSHWGGANDGVWHGPVAAIELLVARSELYAPNTVAQCWIDTMQATVTPLPLALTQTALGSIFPVTTAAFSVDTSAPEITWRIQDVWGNQIASRTVTPESGEPVTIPAAEYGYYDLTVTAGDATLDTPFAALPPLDPARATPEQFGFSTHFGRWGTDPIDLMAFSGARQARDGVGWATVEKAAGTYTIPAAADAWMQKLHDNNIPVLTIPFGDNPVYDGGKTPYTDAGIAAFAAYAVELVNHWGPQLGGVEVWNEYNIPQFSTGPGATDVHNYEKILEATYAAVKAVRPDLPVLGPATSGVPMTWLEDLFKLGALNHLDVVSVHPYRYMSPPEGLDDQMQQLDALVKQYNGGVSKPIWISEIGWPTDTQHHVSERAQAEDFVRACVLAVSVGVERFFWYDLVNDGLDRTYNENNYGVLRAVNDPLGEYTPKPAYVAFGVMNRQLAGTTYDRRETAVPAGVRSYVFRDAAAETRVMWSTTGRQDVTLTTAGAVQITDMMGRSRSYQPDESRVFVSLGGDPVFVSGTISAVIAGSTIAIEAGAVAIGDSVPITLRVDATGSSTPVPASFCIIGSTAPETLTAAAGTVALRTVSVPGLDQVGTRTVIADVKLRGRRAARIAADVPVLVPLTVQVASLVVAAAPLQTQLTVSVTNNSSTQTRTISTIAWTVGPQNGTLDVNSRLAAGASTQIVVPLPAGLLPWKPYDASVTVHADSLATATKTLKATFAPVPRRTITVDGTLDAGVSDLPAMDLSADGRWTTLNASQPYAGAGDAGGKAWLFFDDGHLHLVAAITDNTFSQNYTGANTWQGDSIQFAIAAGSPASGGPTPYRFALALTPSGPQLNRDLAPAGVALGLVTAATVAIGRNGTTTVYEAAIPWAETPLNATTGPFAFDLLYNDNDGSGRKGYLEWGVSLGSGSPDPSQFFACQLAQA